MCKQCVAGLSLGGGPGNKAMLLHPRWHRYWNSQPGLCHWRGPHQGSISQTVSPPLWVHPLEHYLPSPRLTWQKSWKEGGGRNTYNLLKHSLIHNLPKFAVSNCNSVYTSVANDIEGKIPAPCSYMHSANRGCVLEITSSWQTRLLASCPLPSKTENS